MIAPPHQLPLHVLSPSHFIIDFWKILLLYLSFHVTYIKWWQLFLQKPQTALSHQKWSYLTRNKSLHWRMKKLSSKLQKLKQFANILILLFLQPSCEILAWPKIWGYGKRNRILEGGGCFILQIWLFCVYVCMF